LICADFELISVAVSRRETFGKIFRENPPARTRSKIALNGSWA
jgi:hypothetical protein